MNRTDRLRLWIVLIVVAAALCFAYFNRDGLNLGLDLRGGASGKRHAREPARR